MSDSTPLIERAAALLRDHGDDLAPPAGTTAAGKPVSPAILAPPLSRRVTLDRVRLAQAGIIMPWTSTARVVEEYRIIKRQIMQAWQFPQSGYDRNKTARVVMVTSARPREGKTFSSINLALAFAAEERLVTILVDADSVRGDAARVLNIPPEPGLTGVLAGNVSLQDALVQTDLPNLIVLPPGAPGPHIPELLSSRAPGTLLGEISKRYPEHLVVMDTAPCLASTDPVAIASLVSQIVFVVEAGHTQKAEIETSLSLLNGGQNISFVLNKAPAESSEHFGSYSYYFSSEKK